MQWKNSAERYGYLSVLLHWGVAFTVYGMFALGLWMVSLGYYDIWYHRAPEIHKSIGILLFIVLVIRMVWRWVSPPPPALTTYTRVTRLSATLAHWLLYGILFSILITGYFISTANGQSISVFGWFEIPASLADGASQADSAGTIHLYLAWSVVVLSALHALAAFKHHLFDKDATLKRMLGMKP